MLVENPYTLSCWSISKFVQLIDLMGKVNLGMIPAYIVRTNSVCRWFPASDQSIAF
jgi:hypothetical protein